MKQYRITATLLSPLAVQRTRQSKAPQTLTYLPGSTFRGAVAAKYLRDGGTPEDDVFKMLFLDNPSCFPNLISSSNNNQQAPSILPLTCVTCKRHPGFLNQGGHGVHDLLAGRLLEKVDSGAGPDQTCKICGNHMKPYTGFWNGDPSAPLTSEPTLFFQRHTGIDRTTGAVANEIFYTTQAMTEYKKNTDTDSHEPQRLSGRIYLDATRLNALKDILKEPIFAGQDRTRGMGELQIAIEPLDAAPLDMESWDHRFKTMLKKFGGGLDMAEIAPGRYFSLKIETHTILVDRYLRPSAELPLDFPNIEYVLKIAKKEEIKGWNEVWGLAKPNDTGVMMGSVYLFRYTGTNFKGLQEYLSELMVNGIGLRREEGFGSVQVCDPIHLLQEVSK